MFRTALLASAVVTLTAVQAEDPKPGSAPYSDATFMAKAANCCTATMQAVELAATNGKSEAVRKFAKNMLEDHKKTKEKLDAAAKTTSQDVSKLDAAHQKEIDTLKGLKDESFDKAFLDGVIKSHEKAVIEFKQAKENTKDEAVKDFVSSTLSIMEKHLDTAKKIQANGR